MHAMGFRPGNVKNRFWPVLAGQPAAQFPIADYAGELCFVYTKSLPRALRFSDGRSSNAIIRIADKTLWPEGELLFHQLIIVLLASTSAVLVTTDGSTSSIILAIKSIR
jgi:hypothetical protein